SKGRWNERLRCNPGSPCLSLLGGLGRCLRAGVLRGAIRHGHRTVGRRRGIWGFDVRTAAARGAALEAREARTQLLGVALGALPAVGFRDLWGRWDRRRRTPGQRGCLLDDLRAIRGELAQLGERLL